ncbi:Zn-ribbon domain-containing OB-fold protein [Mycobacterium crocinum]|uniref:Zn-ribbon domain-containing OB-fold protein n=1 Tax=Mycolicibacterium crocinum TaxID=388459 RepID=A0ABY3TGE9_9MYCO|nr:Zn-ribbon domain-containing OB-fold protein [Mycolicibacterium crocinum]MCV7218640.1 Zn-ribbon domain-containing OB-fold protein [Mycolicibacterium crocinum]ULN39213.1 Zn-ribbon domain-containing OB-fold protein [Mycolicibacterium crocinum]
MSYQRPDLRLAPSPTPESQAFWTGGREGNLLISHCRACGHFFHPPGPACWRCRSTDVGPEKVSGRGSVAAFSVDRQPWIPGFEPPYIVAMVEIAEEPGVRLISNVVDVEPADMRIGLEVDVFFEDWTGLSGEEDTRVWIPLFRPVTH